MSALLYLAFMAFMAGPTSAFWRLPCASPVVVERADPIVQPNAVSGHVHTVMGGNAFDFNMSYATTQQSDCTSCQVHGDLSNYWTPTLYYRHKNGTFQQVKQNGGMLVYYLQRRGSDSEHLQAFPKDFRMVAGEPSKRTAGTDFASQAISYHCLDYSGKTTNVETGGFPNYNCPNGLRSQVFFPACWDGKNLDSTDHKSHVAYPIDAYNNGHCPDTHPVHLISIFYEIIWETDQFADMWYGDSQPFVWSMGDTTGYGLHGDFLNGWNVDLLQRAVDTCTDDSGRVEDCHQFTLFSAQEAGQCKKQSTVNEALDFVDALPGCNPVGNSPAGANCAKVPDVVGGQPSSYGGGGSTPSSSLIHPVSSSSSSSSSSGGSSSGGSSGAFTSPATYAVSGISSVSAGSYPMDSSSKNNNHPVPTTTTTTTTTTTLTTTTSSLPSSSTPETHASSTQSTIATSPTFTSNSYMSLSQTHSSTALQTYGYDSYSHTYTSTHTQTAKTTFTTVNLPISIATPTGNIIAAHISPLPSSDASEISTTGSSSSDIDTNTSTIPTTSPTTTTSTSTSPSGCKAKAKAKAGTGAGARARGLHPRQFP